MISRPLVSVIVPVYNGKAFLAQAIQNIQKQDYQPLEIIVVDDGSTDNTAQIAASFQDKIRYFYQPNRGPAAARNKGIQMAKGDVLAFLDVDDRWAENSLKQQLSYLADSPATEIVTGMIQEVTAHKAVANDHQFNAHNTHTLTQSALSEPFHFINLGSSIYRRGVFEKVGLFDESLRYGEDIDWFMRAWEMRISKYILDEVTLFYHRHRSSMTAGKNMVEMGIVRVYKKHIERFRKQENLSEAPLDNFPGIAEYIGSCVNRLQNNDFTIISNDDWGGAAYRSLGLMYKTPFVETRILPPCYLKLLKNLKGYLDSPLTFSNHSRYDLVNQEREKRKFPIGILGDDVEIHFYQEESETQVKQNWERRLQRINWNNLFIKFSDGEVAWNGDYLPYLQEFEALDYPYKLCLTAKAYPGFASILPIPDFVPDGSKMLSISRKYFDVFKWLDKTFGNDLQAYIR